LVIVTHDIAAIDRRVNRILCLSEGKLREHDCTISHGEDIFKAVYKNQNISQITHRHN